MYAAADGTRLANLPGREHRLRSAALETLGSSRRDDDQGDLRRHQPSRRRLRPVCTPCVCGRVTLGDVWGASTAACRFLVHQPSTVDRSFDRRFCPVFDDGFRL